MTTVKRIVCLANSRKLNGRCIAGKELSPQGRPISWVRPVSAREHEEISEAERRYGDGNDPCVLDIIDVSLLRSQPKGYQEENWLLDPNHSWVKIGRSSWSDLSQLTDPDAPLWINGSSTYNGLNDQIPLSLANSLESSLRLIRVDHLTLSVYVPGALFGNPKRRLQGRFRYEGTDYWLWVTDPSYEQTYLAKPDGEYAIGESILTISLAEPHKDTCYKLIAAIIQRPEEQPQ